MLMVVMETTTVATLPELPGSKSKYWQGHTEQLDPQVVSDSTKCRHYFLQMTAKEIECKDCGLGLFIDQGDELREGKLFKDDELVTW